jgi:Protein of unknown function (DUF3843)
MSIAIKEIFHRNRPPGVTGRGDKYLPDIAQDLRRLLQKTQRDFVGAADGVPEHELNELATMLVEFGEDLHADIGLWRNLELCNQEFFGMPLPLVVAEKAPRPPVSFDVRRIQHLLWTFWMCLEPDNLPSPTDPNLLRLAETVSVFLTERFAPLPKDSGVKLFLAGPSQFGWEVKRKLVWLGTKSYLFRRLFANYVREHGKGETIAVTDDFICQACTPWSGLGAIDLLAATLDVSAEERVTLRGWYERHAAFYRVLSRQDRGEETETITARNLVNGQPYLIRMNIPRCPFQPGMVVFGSLTPWRGEWYWSGEQRPYENVPPAEEANLRRDMLERSCTIAYRYCPEEAAKARESNRRHFNEFVAHYGNDLVVHPDGLTLAAAEQKRMESLWRAAAQEDVHRVMRERGLEHPRPPMKYPREFLDHEQGIGAFYNPEEGLECSLYFNAILSGLGKKGTGLSAEERFALRHFVDSEAISPAFIHRLVHDHGAESFIETFYLRHLPAGRALALLLRCFKGHFYRKRYPTLALLGLHDKTVL